MQICHDVFLWCYVCFVLLRFRLYAFVEAEALRSIILRYAGAPIATPRVAFFLFFLFVYYLEMSLHTTCCFLSFFPFCLFGDVTFSEYFLFRSLSLSLSMESTSYVLSFRMNGVFLPCDHDGLYFLHQLM